MTFEREIAGIEGDELSFMVRMVERAVEELQDAVLEKGMGGLGSVVLEGVVEGVGVRGQWEVGEIVDGEVVECQG